MSPEEAAQRILGEMAKGRSFGNVETGGEGMRNANAARNSGEAADSRGQGFPLDRRGIMSSTTDPQKENGNELQTQRNRVSQQGDGDGLGGESEVGERSRRLLADTSAIGRGVEVRVQESTRVRDKEAESQARLTDYAKKNGARGAQKHCVGMWLIVGSVFFLFNSIQQKEDVI